MKYLVVAVLIAIGVLVIGILVSGVLNQSNCKTDTYIWSDPCDCDEGYIPDADETCTICDTGYEKDTDKDTCKMTPISKCADFDVSDCPTGETLVSEDTTGNTKEVVVK